MRIDQTWNKIANYIQQLTLSSDYVPGIVHMFKLRNGPGPSQLTLTSLITGDFFRGTC